MGLDDLEGMDTPDAVGGRPPKEEEEEYSWNPDGEPFNPKDDTRGWWDKVIGESVDGGEVSGQFEEGFQKDLEDLSDHVHLDLITTRRKLDEHDIVDIDWAHYLGHNPHRSGDWRLPEDWKGATNHLSFSGRVTVDIHTGERNDMVDRFRELMEVYSSDDPTTDRLFDDVDTSSGLGEEEDNEPDASGLAGLIADNN